MRQPAKQKLVQSAQSMLLAKGFPSTTVDEVCAAAAVSKGSFYHYFKTKDDLGITALEAFYNAHMQRLAQGPYRAIRDPLQRALAYLDHAETVAKELWSGGCLLGSFAIELGESNPRIRATVSNLFKQSAAVLARLFTPVAEQAARRGSAPSAAELAEHFIIVVEGSVVLAKAHDDWRVVPQAIRTFKRYLQSLIEA